jgi:hypothetical protein
MLLLLNKLFLWRSLGMLIIIIRVLLLSCLPLISQDSPEIAQNMDVWADRILTTVFIHRNNLVQQISALKIYS